MRKICKVTLNNEPFLANCGDLLLDWALMNGVDLPHDCRSGICGACRVRVVEGQVFGGHEQGDDIVHACQARIVSDVKIVTEAVPDELVVAITRVPVVVPLESVPAEVVNRMPAPVFVKPDGMEASVTASDCERAVPALPD